MTELATALSAQLPAILVMRREADKGAAEDIGDVWDARFQAWLGDVEALPVTPANARIKAMAVAAIHRFDLEAFAEGDSCTDARLVRQILAALLQDA